MSTWLYQFWFFSFKTAKYWGQGPRNWFADILGFGADGVAIFPIPSSYHSPSDRTVHSPHGQTSGVAEWNIKTATCIPSPLCHWTIHVEEPDYEPLPNPHLLEHGAMDPAYPETYQQWPNEWTIPSYSERLRNALESNDFSNIPTHRLPAAIPEALQVAKRDPADLAPESLGFAIMSRNVEMVSRLLKTRPEAKDIDVFHLATSYLDGSKACCEIVRIISSYYPLRQHYTNGLGHTVLDNLMLAILKGHSSCGPDRVDDAFKGQSRFAGEEVDICGRWDAESECIRELLAKGIHQIPFQWKHKFCHTSVQTICHCISSLWGISSAPDINTCSGLFVRRCLQPHCGLKMQMSPLHTLVMVMFQISSHGCDEEDLFGAAAVLLCLLRHGANPSLRSTLSITSLIGANPSANCEPGPDGCEHKALSPLELASAIYSLKNTEWTKKLRLGWQTFGEILRYSQDVWVQRQSQEPPLSFEKGDSRRVCRDCKNGCRENHLGKDGRLGLLRAIINTELVTYRRLDVGQPWNSDNVSLESMLESLQNNCQPDLPLVRDKMMKPSCCCGSFLEQPSDHYLTPDSACAFYFSNMEDWSRTTYLDGGGEDFGEGSYSEDDYSEEDYGEVDQQ
jgi:hypothetical protein